MGRPLSAQEDTNRRMLRARDEMARRCTAVEQPHGTDLGIRDPCGNHVRINQPATNLRGPR